MARKKAPVPEPDLFEAAPPMQLGLMRRAVLGYLAAQSPAGLAMRVPARVSRFQSDVAAFWVQAHGRGRNVTSRLSRTVAVDIFQKREECLPHCADSEKLTRELRNLRFERLRLEAMIRETEPWLADDGELFPEFRTYNYQATSNEEYLKLLRRHTRVQHALFKGSRLESVRQAGVADYLYMAVPQGEVEADEIADGWGLLHVLKDGRVKVARVASRQICSAESRLHLAFNISMRSVEAVLFSQGVEVSENGDVKLIRPPRRRRK